MRTVVRFAAVATFAVATAGAQSANPVQPAQSSTPTSAELIARYVKAVNPQGMHARHMTSHATGTIEIPGTGITGTVETFSGRPARSVTRIALGAVGDISSGFDGTVGWVINPATGPMLMDSIQVRRLRHLSSYDNVEHPAAAFRSISAPTAEEFEGKRAYVLHLTSIDGFEYDELFDPDTGLRRGLRFHDRGPTGDVSVVSVFEDYKLFDGIMVPTTVTQRSAMQTIVQRTSAVEFNTVPDSVFTLPAEIKALVSH